ncbi:MAG: helix-turn-helix domain-containing protein [Bacteroidales bacterium]|nr:helix-turn-helix domain-containing protein [Bacteroidales bacterium]
MVGKIDLYINEANDYARDIGAPVWHPHVSVVHYDEVGAIRHSMNRYNVYGLFLQREFPENLTYGIGKYHEAGGSLLALSPGQIGGKLDDGTRRQYHGWVLLFDAQFIHDSEIGRRLADYHFFSYNANEALFLTTDEKEVLAGLMANVRKEIQNSDEGQDDIIRDYILLILDYCRRFYARQFKEMTTANSDILSRFQQLLTDYYNRGLQHEQGLPSVKYCASELCLSAGYFGDIMREAMGESPKEYIRSFIIQRAKNLILGGCSISQVADKLGFEYPQHFTRMFKNTTGMTPRQFHDKQRGK